MAVLRVGEPRRHLFSEDVVLDGLCPGPGVFVAHQGKGRDLAGPVTLLAAGLEDGFDVFVKRDLLRDAGGEGSDCENKTNTGKNACATRACCHYYSAPRCGLARKAAGSVLASKATSNQPIIISSHVWSPQRT